MILDQKYSKYKKKLTISYINDDGLKSFLEFNINRFKTYYHTPAGKYKDWKGARCDEKWTESPSKFDIMNYIYNLDDKYKTLLTKTKYPKLYTWDIENKYVVGEKVDVVGAKNEITTISICSPELVNIVLGTKELSEEDIKQKKVEYLEYIQSIPNIEDMKNIKPRLEYKKFDSEIEMLEYFLRDIVAKVPVLAGWNSDNYDWLYLSNRLKNFYPNTTLRISSPKYDLSNSVIYDYNKNKIQVQKPSHTLLVDMMDVVMEHDYSVLDIKESSSLDWISEAALGIKKLEYDGNLNTLYDDDYPKYVLYNAIDSLLVQLIDKRFQTMNIIYNYSTYCMIPIGRSFSKIATTEALVLKDFHKNDIKVVWEEHDRTRGKLFGAYVAVPVRGKHEWTSCNDFSGLYPATLITCNMSFENRINPCDYYKDINKTSWDEEQLDAAKNNPNFFVSVNNNIYKNDKEYSFSRIQRELRLERDVTKYQSKSLDAQLMSRIDQELERRKIKNKK